MSLPGQINMALLTYEKLQGRRAKYIVLSEATEKIFYDQLPYWIHRTDGAVFENPKEQHRQFMGTTILTAKVRYGDVRDFQFMLGE